jgi:hypothetical protein
MKTKLLFYFFLSSTSLIAFLKCYEYARTLRGNDVVGGEIGLLLIPFIVYMAIKIYKDDRKAKNEKAYD